MSQAASAPFAAPAQAQRILSFWHKVEFFESAELKGIDHGQGAIHYRSDELVEAAHCLPWLGRAIPDYANAAWMSRGLKPYEERYEHGRYWQHARL
ncbi:hypothetical protein [Vreelandella sp. EE7]